jgi:hypothetical protein
LSLWDLAAGWGYLPNQILSKQKVSFRSLISSAVFAGVLTTTPTGGAGRLRQNKFVCCSLV